MVIVTSRRFKQGDTIELARLLGRPVRPVRRWIRKCDLRNKPPWKRPD
jgi:hypothetical protein